MGELLLRFMYSSVQQHISVSQVPMPLLKDSSIQEEINRLALEANAKHRSLLKAERAIHITNKDVIHANEWIKKSNLAIKFSDGYA